MNVQDFNFLSGDEIDNIVFYAEGQLSGATASLDTAINGYFLPFLIYSPDGSTWYRENSTRYTSAGVPTDNIHAYVYPNKVYISGAAGQYYRIAGVRI